MKGEAYLGRDHAKNDSSTEATHHLMGETQYEAELPQRLVASIHVRRCITQHLAQGSFPLFVVFRLSVLISLLISFRTSSPNGISSFAFSQNQSPGHREQPAAERTFHVKCQPTQE